ncbi:MAG: hypothetical protein KDI17_14895 [Halioglobus sp.]|nr:hypothetical protein [Halioglobus sp.]
MSENLSPYRVGNIIYADFGRIPSWGTDREGRQAPEGLWQTSEAAYLKAIDSPDQLGPDSRAALVLALTKLLDAESDGERCALLALRLATIEQQMAVTDCVEKPDAKRFLADQSLEHLESVLDYVAGGVQFIEDGEQLVVAPAAIYIRMAVAHLLVGDQSEAAMCIDSAEKSLAYLNFDGAEWVRGKLLEQIRDLRQRLC